MLEAFGLRVQEEEVLSRWCAQRGLLGCEPHLGLLLLCTLGMQGRAMRAQHSSPSPAHPSAAPLLLF